jgi:ketosteroid isomerase-like protein
MKYLIYFFLPFTFVACTAPTEAPPPPPFDPVSVQPVIEQLNASTSKGIQDKNATLIAAHYDKAARLCPDNDTYVNGQTAIENWWKESVPMLNDITFTTISLEGTREVLYETGMATTTINMNDSVWVQNDKFVHVWRMQPDSSYKLVVDVWNGIGK